MKVLMIARSTLNNAPGGDTIQVQNTAKQLRLLGVEVDVKLHGEKMAYEDYDIMHFFNVIRPDVIISHIEKTQIPYVISTIYVNYEEVELKGKGSLFKSLSKTFGNDGIEYLKAVARHLNKSEPLKSKSYWLKGHRKSIVHVLNEAQMLLPNSKSEYVRLQQSYGIRKAFEVVPNAMDPEVFLLEKVLPAEQKKGVLCVGRIEPIKNQLNLIKALNNTNYELTLIGKAAPNHKLYYEKCREIAKDNITFIPHINQEDLVAYYANAKVHALVSWFETTGLASLEAGAMGCQLVISDRGDTVSYFGEDAFYADPDNIEAIQNAIQKAYEQEGNAPIMKRIRLDYTWDKAAERTLEAYHLVLNSKVNVL